MLTFILDIIKRLVIYGKNEQVHLDRSIDLFSALALVIGTVIGSGIFFKQASVLSYSHSTTLALLAWFFGGVLTLTSGLTIAEIGSQMPQTGGLYIYMHNLYGKVWGFYPAGCRSPFMDRLLLLR